MYKLVIQDDEGKTTVVPLIRDEITIGRKEGNTIRLTERNVSRRHARIHRSNGAVSIEDLDSYNGVLVNGARIEGRADLGESDRVQIGDYLLELKSDRAVDARPARTGPETQPLSRVDPTGATPVPEVVSDAASDAATRPVVAPAPAAAPRTTGAPASPAAAAGDAAHAVHALADTDPGEATLPSALPRLVVLSSNFAGEEFVLDKPAAVIGRTDDNDIVIDHRSISRHHAKIVQEHGRFAVVDLQSSNGVRVNGEEYGKVELRRGDVVDLGHVRLRFVDAGEDFVLGRDAEIIDLAAVAAGGRRGMWWAIAGIGAAIAIVAVLATRGGGAGDEPAAAAGAGTPVVEHSGPAPGVAHGGGQPTVELVDAAARAQPDKPDLSRQLAAAVAALDRERWADMQAAAMAALAIDSGNAEALRFKRQAERELANEIRYRSFQQAARGRDWAAIKASFTGIARDSVYRARAQADYDAKKEEFLASVRTEARALAVKGDCRALQHLATTSGKLWSEGKKVALEQLPGCRRVAAAAAPGRRPPRRPAPARPPRGHRPPARPPSPRSPPAVKKPPAPRRSPDELAEEASDEAKRGNYGRAYKLCEDALDIQSNHPRARMVCTIASCRLKNAKRARRHYGGLSSRAKRAVKPLCAALGVQLE